MRIELRQGAVQQNKLRVSQRHIMATGKAGATMHKPVRIWLRHVCGIHVLCRIDIAFFFAGQILAITAAIGRNMRTICQLMPRQHR